MAEPARRRGHRFEKLARHWLEARGLRTVARNYNCRLGELDLVMRHREHLVIVEVKYRRGNALVSGPEAVTPSKQARIERATLHYLQGNPRMRDHPVRFDVLSITESGGRERFDWIRDAFRAAL